LGTTLSAGLTSLMDYMGTYVIPSITGAFTTLSTFLDTYVVKPIYSIGSIVATGFTEIGKVTMGFINAILRFPEWFTTYLVNPLITGLKTTIIDPLLKAIMITVTVPSHSSKTSGIHEGQFLKIKPTVPEKVPTTSYWGIPFISWISVVENPYGWFVDKMTNTIGTFAETLWSTLKGIWDSALTALKEVTKSFWEGIKGLAEAIGKGIMDALKGVWNSFTGIGEPLEKFVKDLYQQIPKSTATLTAGFTTPIFEQAFKDFKLETPETLKIDYVTQQLINAHIFTVGIGFLPFYGQIPLRLTSWTMKAIAKFLWEKDWKIRINLKPFGIGVDTEFSFAKAIGASIYQFSEDLMKWLDEIGRGIVYGYAIWTSRPISRVLSYHLRNALPVELPRVEDIIEFTQRTLPYEKSEEIMKIMKYYMALYGFSDTVLDQYFKSANELFITVTDRFEAQRKIPLSLVYNLPSASDVATMMVRDIFPNIDEFRKLYLARGMEKDIGCLYYFLRFRYPPPERLWSFTTRGISGLLWATLPDEELADIRKEADAISAYLPKSPIEFNKMDKDTNTKLFNAFKTYMKWHDYARFSWIKDYPSDNLIYIDNLADIPTKIDQRWMVKWGLYELLKNKQVMLQSPVSDFRTKIVEGEAKSEIQLDLTLFARTLQATGIHPDWIPLTAVAEAMNVLTEERTTLRTGFINLFKEGFWDTDSIETLLAGAITASFAVSYFDMTKLEWGKGWVNQPVMFLPAERKLIELRALMDRALDILRETQRDISRGYSEWIIESYDEYKERLTKIIESINVFFSADYKAITGVELPEKLKLTFVEEYYKPYIESLNIWRDIFTVRRIRYWTQRWLGWILYRIATGVVSKEEYERLIAYVVNYAKLTPTEKEYLEGVFDVLQGIAVKQSQSEYIPTPTMLATICEIIPKAREYFDDVVVAKRIPDKWVPIWADYVDYKPLVDEIKKMVSRAENLYTYFIVTEEDYKKVLDQVQFLGYTPKEIEYMLYNSRLERFRRAWAELIGDVDRMTMLAEYSPKARDFALGQLYKMIDALPIAQDTKAVLKEMWEQFIRLKPVMDEVRRYVTDLINAYVDGTISDLTFSNELEALKEWGLDDYEIQFYKAIASLRKARKLKITIG
jgi:hypothetical protein